MAKADASVKRKPALTVEQQIDHLKEKGVITSRIGAIFSSSPHTVSSSQSTKAESRMGATLR